MAVDWSSYRLAPDFSGLAAGIQGYFQNRQAAEIAAANQAMEQQKMGMEQAYRDRMLALEEQKMMAPVSQKNQFYADLFEQDGQYYRVGNDPAGNPIIIPMPEGFKPTSGIGGQLAYGPQIAALEGQKELIKAQQRGLGQQQTVAGVKEQEGIGQQRSVIKSDYRNLGRAATKQLNTVSELERALSAIETGKVESAFASLKKNLGFDASGYENADAAVYAVASDLLKQEPGPKTDFDFNAKVEQLANSKRQKEANRLIIERLRRSAQYDTANVKNFNKWVNNGNDPLEYTDLDYEEFLAEKGPKGQGAKQPASQSKAVIDYNQYED